MRQHFIRLRFLSEDLVMNFLDLLEQDILIVKVLLHGTRGEIGEPQHYLVCHLGEDLLNFFSKESFQILSLA